MSATVSPPAPASAVDRVSDLARELADLVKASKWPEETLSSFVTFLVHRHNLDLRKVHTFAERWEAGKKWTDEQIREYMDRRRAEFTRADAEEYLKEDKYIPFEDVIAELEEIHRQHQEKGANGVAQ
jgi:hypothetical protein